MLWDAYDVENIASNMQEDAIRTARNHSAFIPVTGLKCSYGKISSSLTNILVFSSEISETKPARSLIWTHQKFTKYLKLR